MRYILPLLFFFITTNLFAQEQKQFFDGIRYQTEAGAYLSTSGQNAFWLRSNQYGTVPLESQILTFQAGLWKDYQNNNDSSIVNRKSYNRKLQYGYGLQAVANVGKVNQILLPEAYFKVRFKAFEFYVGRRREIFGLVDTTLSSGSYIWSGNALPMPKVQISIPDYTSILGKGLISIKGNFAHGWFGNQTMVKNYYLHQKTFYLRVGKPNWRVRMYTGFNHQVQWGGTAMFPIDDLQPPIKLLSDWAAYIKVVTGKSVNFGNRPNTVANEAFNRIGNHLGNADIGFEIIGDKTNILAYRQSFYEDGSLYYLNNISDGLYGMSIQFKNRPSNKFSLNKLCFEYLYTANQGGKSGSGSTIPQLRGQDNYFNNGVYQDNWTYNFFTLGTPFLSPALNIKNTDLSQFISSTYILNSRMKGWHIALSGKYNKALFITKLSQTQNSLVYGSTLNKSQFSILQTLQYPYKKYQVINKIAFDWGDLYNNGLSIYFGFKKSF